MIPVYYAMQNQRIEKEMREYAATPEGKRLQAVAAAGIAKDRAAKTLDRFWILDDGRRFVTTFHDQPGKAARYRQNVIRSGALILDEQHISR